MLDRLNLIEHAERIIDAMGAANPDHMGEVPLGGFHEPCGLTAGEFDSALRWLIDHECVEKLVKHGATYIRVLPL